MCVYVMRPGKGLKKTADENDASTTRVSFTQSALTHPNTHNVQPALPPPPWSNNASYTDKYCVPSYTV